MSCILLRCIFAQRFAGVSASFTITARDSAGNRRTSGGDTFLISLEGMFKSMKRMLWCVFVWYYVCAVPPFECVVQIREIPFVLNAL